MPSAGPSPPSTNYGFWLRPMLPPLNPAPSVPCSAVKVFTPRISSLGVASARPAFSRALTPHKRGPKSKAESAEEENAKAPPEEPAPHRGTAQSCIVIDVQKKVGASVGVAAAEGGLRGANPDGCRHPVGGPPLASWPACDFLAVARASFYRQPGRSWVPPVSSVPDPALPLDRAAPAPLPQ